jgi:hypothetical protein
METGEVYDETVSDNGDGRKIFHTVLQTIPLFFEKFPNAAISVEGSDSKNDFHKRCFITCKKNCKQSSHCKKKDQRINVYKKII